MYGWPQASVLDTILLISQVYFPGDNATTLHSLYDYDIFPKMEGNSSIGKMNLKRIFNFDGHSEK